jgi:hypothetical protein
MIVEIAAKTVESLSTHGIPMTVAKYPPVAGAKM